MIEEVFHWDKDGKRTGEEIIITCNKCGKDIYRNKIPDIVYRYNGTVYKELVLCGSCTGRLYESMP